MNRIALSSLVAGVAVSAMAAAAKRARPSIDPRTGNPRLRYPLSHRLILWLLTAGLALAIVVPVIAKPENRSPKALINIAAILGLFVPLLAYLLPETSRVSITWSHEEIVSHSPWTGTRVVRWQDVARVRFSHVAACFVIESRSGTVVRVSTMLSGLPAFAKALRERLDPSVYASCDKLIGNLAQAG